MCAIFSTRAPVHHCTAPPMVQAASVGWPPWWTEHLVALDTWVGMNKLSKSHRVVWPFNFVHLTHWNPTAPSFARMKIYHARKFVSFTVLISFFQANPKSVSLQYTCKASSALLVNASHGTHNSRKQRKKQVQNNEAGSNCNNAQETKTSSRPFLHRTVRLIISSLSKRLREFLPRVPLCSQAFQALNGSSDRNCPTDSLADKLDHVSVHHLAPSCIFGNCRCASSTKFHRWMVWNAGYSKPHSIHNDSYVNQTICSLITNIPCSRSQADKSTCCSPSYNSGVLVVSVLTTECRAWTGAGASGQGSVLVPNPVAAV